MAGPIILIGHYDSPFVRRVGVSMHVLGIAYERMPLSVFRHGAELRRHNPLGRVPALVLESGETLIDSGAILDHLDETVGPSRALLPRSGPARRDALGVMALATGISEKAMAIAYERRRRADKIDQDWLARVREQLDSALAALDRSLTLQPQDGPTQAAITTATALGYVRLREPDAHAPGRYAALDLLSARCEATAPFRACLPGLDEIGGDETQAKAALDRLRAVGQHGGD
jgi:glutathione S-transferase